MISEETAATPFLCSFTENCHFEESERIQQCVPKKGNFFMKEMGSFALSMKGGLVHARLEARVPDRCCETYHRGTIKEKQFRTFTSHALYSEMLLFLTHDIMSRPLYFLPR